MVKTPEKRNLPANSPAGSDSDPIAEEIAKRIGSLLPRDQRLQVVAQVTSLVKEESFSGPIPHPRHLAQYEEILPGSAATLIGMAKSDLEHAQAMQKRALEADIADMKEGRRLGFAALVILMLGSIVCGAMGQETIALALLGATVVGTISQLVKGRGKNGE